MKNNSRKALFPLILCGLLICGGRILTAQESPEYRIGRLIYENPLTGKEDLERLVIESSEEGQPDIRFVERGMQLESNVHFLLWFPPDLPADIVVTWNFMPQVDDGLAMCWFCANGRSGKDLFDPSLKERTGNYPQYHSGDIDAYHLSYFRRNPWDDPTMNTVNLRKSFGNHLVATAANPIPNVEVEKVSKALKEPYRIRLVKYRGDICLEINDLPLLEWKDEDPYQGGKLGFRQMANLVAVYSDLKVYELKPVE